MAKTGVLEVTLRHAQDLKDVELIGRQDPYCILSLAGQTFRSKTHTDGGRSPQWNQTFVFPNVSSDMMLKLEFFDENMVLRDVAIGGSKITLAQVANSGVEEVSVPVVTRKGKHRGDAFLKLQFKQEGIKPAPPPARPAAPLPQQQAQQQAQQMQPQPQARPPQPPASQSQPLQQPRVAADPVKPANAQAPVPAFNSAPRSRGASSWILPTYANTDCWKDYEPGTILGKGTFGTTYLATRKGTTEKYAVKVISKRKLVTTEEIDDVRREVQIMHHLAGHPNVVCLKNVYEDKSNVCLVMEVCTGGELFDSIVKKGRYTEKDAAALIRTIVSVVAHCHNMGVIHRDLKPENFLLSDKNSNAPLKATDFGLSSFFQEGQVFTDIVGSAYYVAPEVLRRNYSKEADIWSCGVILYILLCGYPPFHGENEKKIFEAVISKPLDFNADPWPKVSEPAKDCVRRMLVRDPRKRATAQQILQHEWMRENGVASDNSIELEVLTRMRKFSAMNRLKKEALKVIAINLPMDEISGMREIFQEIDRDKSGTITVEEFAQALRKKGSLLPEDEVKRLMQEADVNGDGTIDYEEFLAATINRNKFEREEHLRMAFEQFDLDGDGHITHAELMQALSKMGITDSNIQEIIREVDKDNNGSIEYNEFCAMMRAH